MKKIIIFSFIVPFAFLLAFFFMRRFYTGGLILPKQPFSYSEQEIEIRAVDASLISASYISVQNKKAIPKRQIVVMIPGLNRDRNWDGKGFSPSMGRRVADFLAQNGFDSLRFDLRGTGKSRASRTTYRDTRLQVRDLAAVLSYLKNLGYTEKKIIYLSLGEYGAHLALLHLKAHPKMQALVLLNAKVPKHYLEAWGDEIFRRMEEKNASPSILAQCKKEWRIFYEKGRLVKNRTEDPADLQAFRNTLSYLLRPENKIFYSFSRDFGQKDFLQNLQKNEKVYQWFGEFVYSAQKKYHAFPLFQLLQIMKKTDFLLREYETHSQYLLARLIRELHPSIRLSQDFQRLFLKNFAKP